jgi:sterol desaturase/sphingolipid hydroxylase (fatty acid hydroxylase superfamily)
MDSQHGSVPNKLLYATCEDARAWMALDSQEDSMTPLFLIIAVGVLFFILERIRPGRDLPSSRGWYARAIFLNLCQLGVVLLGGITWNRWLQGPSILHVSNLMPPAVQGLLCWFVGTFVFYWWHRARHSALLWRALHQIHHSPTRIEALTSFYKHPLEIVLNSILSATIVFALLGASLDAAPWYNFFAALGEFYYHSNIKTPRWTGYFIQRPEHHSIHHQLNVHGSNYGDVTWWDRLFGTFRETDAFAPACGYEGRREERILAMLAFQDVNSDVQQFVQPDRREDAAPG